MKHRPASKWILAFARMTMHEVQKGLATVEVRGALEKIGYEPTAGTPDAYAAQAAKTYALYQRMLKETSLTLE